MIITVKIDNVEISIKENSMDSDRYATMRYNDQNKQIQDTIKVIAEECVKLRKLTLKSDVVSQHIS